MVELGVDVWHFGGGVESVAGVESMAGVSVVGLLYGSVLVGVGLVYGFGLWAWAVGLIVVVSGLRFKKWV